MKILVIGSTGMAGHVITRYMKEQNHEVYNISSMNSKLPDTYMQIDVTDESHRKLLEKTIRDIKPEIVINAIGLLVKACNDNPDKAIAVNSYFPHFLASLSKQTPFKLIHLSTDCVFSGKTTKQAYDENDPKDETNMYGVSKSAGEVTYDPHLTIRTSIVGPELKKDGVGLLNWFLNQTGLVNGYMNSFWNGVTTYELAQFIEYIMKYPVSGLVHINCWPIVSKASMLATFKRAYNKTDVLIVPVNNDRVNKSVMKTRTDFIYNSKTFDEMIDELVKWYG